MLRSILGFPGSSRSKESTCNAGDPISIPGSGRSCGEGIGYPLQYFWASLVAQMVKNLPARWDTQVQSLGWEDLLEEGMATYSSILAWRIPMDIPWGHKVGHDWATKHTSLWPMCLGWPSMAWLIASLSMQPLSPCQCCDPWRGGKKYLWLKRASKNAGKVKTLPTFDGILKRSFY